MVAQCGNRRQARIAHYVGVRLVGDSPSRDAGKHLAFAGCVRLQVRPREWGAAARASFLTRRSRSTIASAHVARADEVVSDPRHQRDLRRVAASSTLDEVGAARGRLGGTCCAMSSSIRSYPSARDLACPGLHCSSYEAGRSRLPWSLSL